MLEDVGSGRPPLPPSQAGSTGSSFKTMSGEEEDDEEEDNDHVGEEYVEEEKEDLEEEVELYIEEEEGKGRKDI